MCFCESNPYAVNACGPNMESMLYIYFFFTHKTAWLDSSLFVELIQRRLNIYAPLRRLKTTFHFVEKNALKYNVYIIML